MNRPRATCLALTAACLAGSALPPSAFAAIDFTRTDFPTAGGGANAVALRDLDLDGDPPPRGRDQRVGRERVLLGNGSGGFGAATDPPGGKRS